MTRTLLTPYDFQRDIILLDKHALFCDMGTGKSLIVINQIRNKFKLHGGVLRTLVFCPLIVIKNWKDEFLLSTQLPPPRICVINASTAKARLRQMKESNVVNIINYDALLNKDIEKALSKFKPQIIICDESHKIKSRTSKRFKAIQRIAKDSTYRYILTGTPVTNTIMDLYSQYLFLDGGKTFGSNFFAFRNRYFVDLNQAWKDSGNNAKYFPNLVVNKRMLPEITAKLKATSIRIKKEDCLDLPNFIEQRVEIPLNSEQRKHYEQVKTHFITWLDEQEDNPLVIKNALTKLLRLNEISTGYMRLEDDTIYKFKKNPRLEAMSELVESLAPHKVILYAVYKENYNDITKRLCKMKINYVELHGGVTAKEKMANVDLFNDLTNDVRVCLANPRSAGLGVNLKSARYKIYYSRTYALDDFEQSKARNYRAGSIDFHEKITDYHLVSPDSIDEIIYNKLKNKQKFAESLLDIKRIL